MHTLTGNWKITRAYDDGTTATGTAIISATGDYSEDVITTFANGQTAQGTRRYKVTQAPTNITLHFVDGPDDGKLFQHFVFTGDNAASSHQCSDDHYNSTWHWQSADQFVLCHTVTGPRKNYQMETQYRRLY